jgi:hypothetical protein
MGTCRRSQSVTNSFSVSWCDVSVCPSCGETWRACDTAGGRLVSPTYRDELSELTERPDVDHAHGVGAHEIEERQVRHRLRQSHHVTFRHPVMIQHTRMLCSCLRVENCDTRGGMRVCDTGAHMRGGMRVCDTGAHMRGGMRLS